MTASIRLPIQGFLDPETEAVFRGRHPKGFPANLLKTARRKLRMVDAAGELADLNEPPGNRLHSLKDDRDGQHAIWINDRFRVCFRWTDRGPADVEIVDYH